MLTLAYKLYVCEDNVNLKLMSINIIKGEQDSGWFKGNESEKRR